MTTEGSQASADDRASSAPELRDPGLARDRTALAWTRSALNMAGSGVLIARAAFTANLDLLGVAIAIAIAALAFLTWRHGRVIYERRRRPGMASALQTREFTFLTTATVLIAALAIAVTIAI